MARASRETRPDETQPCKRCGGSGREQDDRAIGARMRQRREDADLSLRDLGARLNLTAGYLCDLELGRRRWSPENVKRYTEVL